MRRLFLMMGFVTALNSCGQSSRGIDSSTISDISIPTSESGRRSFLWIEGGVFFAAECTPGTLAVRENCTQNIRQRPQSEVLADFQVKLSREKELARTAHLAEISRLKDADHLISSLKAEIAVLQTEIQQLETELAKIDVDLASLSARSAELLPLISQYQEQIVSVDTQLQAHPGDADLLKLKMQLVTEKTALDKENATNIDLTHKLQERRQLNQEALPPLVSQKTSKEATLQARYDSLPVSSPKLEELVVRTQLLEAMGPSVTGVTEKAALAGIAYRADLLPDSEFEIARWFSELINPSVTRTSGTDHLLEVFHENEWRGVCDDDFGQNEAVVACRSMGLQYVSFRPERTGPNGNFWLDEVECQGNESSLFSCRHSPLGRHDCDRNEYVQLICR